MEFVWHNIRFLPVAHRRLGFAAQVRRVMAEFRPDAIAVELPGTLEHWIIRGVMRLPQISAVCYEDAERPGELAYVPIDPCDALIEAVRLGIQAQVPVSFIDLDLPGLFEAAVYMPDDLTIEQTGYDEFVQAIAPYLSSHEEDWQALARESHMATRLRELAKGGGRVLCVLGLAHWLRVRELVEQVQRPDPHRLAPNALKARSNVTLAHVRRRSLPQFLGEMPYLTWLWEQAREEQDLTGETGFDRLGALTGLLREAAQVYQERFRETISLTQWKALFQFTRNLALLGGRLRPDLYELITGAQGVVDGDYAAELLEIARAYPPQDDNSSDLPRLKFIAGFGGGRARLEGREERFTLAPRWPEREGEIVHLQLRRRPPPEMREIWKQQWDQIGNIHTCSWPPEDEVQERFMDYVRKRALQVISDDRKQVVEFSTSLLDGLELRETLRNFHTGKLFVHQTPQPHGRVGSVVLVFEDEPLKPLTGWRATLYAENQNESDIAFYATSLGEQVVGPRISRTEFKGILSIYPAWGIPDIWHFQLGERIKTCAETLLAAAILFSPDRYIAHVSAEAPRNELRNLAAHYGKHIIHMPLHIFSRKLLHKVRKFHILDGRDVRAWARDYIFED